jgi:hypothetical protein
MNERIFEAHPRTDIVHRDLSLVEGLWYFWSSDYRNISGGYNSSGQAESALKQQVLAERQCPSCED